MDFLENKAEISGGQVSQLVWFCKTNIEQVWDLAENSTTDSVTPRLLRLCERANVVGDVLQILQLLASDLTDGGDRKFKIGVRNVEVADAIASAAEEFGWEMVSDGVTYLTRECALKQSESFAHLAKQLLSMGEVAAAALVGNKTREVLQKHIAELDSHEMPVFTWDQPDAKLPDYPEVESFLRGPKAKYHLRGYFHSIAAARSFAERYFTYTNCKVTGYSAKAAAFGAGRGAFCEILKTTSLYQVAKDEWRKEEEEMRRLRRESENLRSVVPETDAATVTTHPNDQHGAKRQRLD
ncbi:unnamed protein product [Calypogeia fissa]